jgi:UDP-4-amino-4,6-dideoxy-N-acetyl-beta-L-altrosamine N-acetyltransferase
MLSYEKCNLRELEEADLDLLLEWRNSDVIRQNMFTDQLITREEHWAWFASLKGRSDRRHMVFVYEASLVGVVNITGIDEMNNRCCWGFYIGDTQAPRGMGTAMGYCGLEYIFTTLGIRKLCSEAFRFNTASIAYHKKLGFQEEGCLRKHYLKNGDYEDVICFSLFRDEWEKGKAGIWRLCFERKCRYE